MAKVIDIKSRANRVQPPKKETVALWQMSQDIDQILIDGITTKDLDPHEVAAIMAHRLGSLINSCEDPDMILDFCLNIIHRLYDENHNAS